MLTSRLDRYPEFAYSPQVCNIGLANDVTTPCLYRPTAIGLQKEFLSVGMQGLGNSGLGGFACSAAVVIVIVGLASWLGRRYPAAF